jgi:hypothetical protein
MPVTAAVCGTLLLLAGGFQGLSLAGGIMYQTPIQGIIGGYIPVIMGALGMLCLNYTWDYHP